MGTAEPGAPPPPTALVLSCEHGGNEVPPRWRASFRGAESVLASHEGWDPGSLDLARALAERLARRAGGGPAREVPVVATTVTRLLVEPNRSRHHPRLFSRFTRDLPPAEREALVREQWAPHRARVEAAVRAGVDGGAVVLHVGVHTFTRVLDGRVREVDVGLLYDPARPMEVATCARWQRLLREALPGVRVRRNVPYRGASDGLTRALRAALPADAYLGVELEVVQEMLGPDGRFPAELVEGLAWSLAGVLGAGEGDPDAVPGGSLGREAR